MVGGEVVGSGGSMEGKGRDGSRLYRREVNVGKDKVEKGDIVNEGDKEVIEREKEID